MCHFSGYLIPLLRGDQGVCHPVCAVRPEPVEGSLSNGAPPTVGAWRAVPVFHSPLERGLSAPSARTDAACCARARGSSPVRWDTQCRGTLLRARGRTVVRPYATESPFAAHEDVRRAQISRPASLLLFRCHRPLRRRAWLCQGSSCGANGVILGPCRRVQFRVDA